MSTFSVSLKSTTPIFLVCMSLRIAAEKRGHAQIRILGRRFNKCTISIGLGELTQGHIRNLVLEILGLLLLKAERPR